MIRPDRGSVRVLDRSVPADVESILARVGYVPERPHVEDAFRRFWSSAEEVPVAFEAAFGVELGEWVLAWTGEQTGVSRAGTGIFSADILIVALTVGVLAALASAAAMRRRVG